DREAKAALADTRGTHGVVPRCRTGGQTGRHSPPAAPVPMDRGHVRSSADLRPGSARIVPGVNKVPLMSRSGGRIDALATVDLHEPLDERESSVRDLAPATVDDQRVPAVRHLN